MIKNLYKMKLTCKCATWALIFSNCMPLLSLHPGLQRPYPFPSSLHSRLPIPHTAAELKEWTLVMLGTSSNQVRRNTTSHHGNHHHGNSHSRNNNFSCAGVTSNGICIGGALSLSHTLTHHSILLYDKHLTQSHTYTS